MTTPTTDLFLVEHLDEARRTDGLPDGDRDALRSVADWIRSFTTMPHEDLGRAGPVCPFVPVSLERRTLWLAPVRVADRDLHQVVDLVDGFRRLFLRTEPTGGDDAIYRVIVVVFTDLAAGRAPDLFDRVLEQIAVPSYVEDGIVYGPFYPGHEGPALYNPDFRPFRSPVPFVFVRQGVLDDWKFFLHEPDRLGLWARRFGEEAALTLSQELRAMGWPAGRR